jgi:hypothetical protein
MERDVQRMKELEQGVQLNRGLPFFNIKDCRFPDAGNLSQLDSGEPGKGAVKLNDPAEKGGVRHFQLFRHDPFFLTLTSF